MSERNLTIWRCDGASEKGTEVLANFSAPFLPWLFVIVSDADIPVGFPKERLPRLNRLQRVVPDHPHVRLLGHLSELHSGLLWSSIGLAAVAINARQHAVLPCGLPTKTLGLHVVDGQIFTLELLAAVLTQHSVPLKKVSS